MRLRTPAFACAGIAVLLLSACGSDAGGGGNPPPPPANVPPTANAGAAQAATSGVTVTLNGTASSDPDGSIASYAWTQTAGAAITLTNGATSQPTFTAPQVAVSTVFTFSLVVTDNRGAPSTNAASVSITIGPPVAGNVNVTGRITFERIPVTAGGLNYAAGVQQPSRGVIVGAVDPANPNVMLATTTTDLNGDYTLSVTGNTNINVVAIAQMLRDNTVPPPRWNFRAMDNDAAVPVPYRYTDGVAFNSSAGTPHNIAIPSGFNASGMVIGTRASAPFAILDTVYQGVQTILGVAPTTTFAALTLDWAIDNPGGETVFEFNNNQQQIVLSADPTEDTDEFDQHVIAHEFGHYIEFNFSRADNIGGSHGLGDKLDIRVAFGEGFGYAFGAIVLNDPLARDTFVSQQQFANCVPGSGAFLCSSSFNVETNPATNPPGTPNGNFGCWCSESSVWSILWDLNDNVADANDNVALGFAPLWGVLINEQRTTPAFTSIFSFISALKGAQPAQAANIDALIAAQNITASGIDAFASNETHFPTPVPSAAAIPVYTTLTAGSSATLSTVDDAGTYNTLGNHRFVRFQKNTVVPTTVTATSTGGDADVIVYRNGSFAGIHEVAGDENFTLTTTGTYVFDVYECANGCSAGGGFPGDFTLTLTIN